jgi:hypothetical protein
VLSALLLSGVFSLGLEYAIERLEKLRTRRTLGALCLENLGQEKSSENPDSYYSSLRGSRVPATGTVLGFDWFHHVVGKGGSRRR